MYKNSIPQIVPVRHVPRRPIFITLKWLGSLLKSCIHRGWNPILIFHFILLKIKKAFKVEFNDVDLSTQSELIDIVILTVSKDYTLVEEVIKSIKENLKHKISNLYIVSQKNTEMLEFCEKHNHIFIDEVSVLGYGKDSINYTVNGKDRSGWIFQQLLKLSGDMFVSQKKYFILDSDTILIKPHLFIRDGKYLFLQSEEWHTPYFRAFKKLFGYESKNKLSYTAHMMMFDVEKLHEMKKEIEKFHKKSWDKAYLDLIDKKENSCVSDYDTYANWMAVNYPCEVGFTPFYNTALSRGELLPIRELVEKYSKDYKSLSFHHYNRNNTCLLRLKGGLGNQMFQYATGLAVVSLWSEELKLDATGYDDPRYINADTPRQYRLFPFGISAKIETPAEVKKYKYPFGLFSKVVRFINLRILKKHYVDYDPSFFRKKNNYIEGYFQSEKNFADIKDKIIKEFILRKEFESEIFLAEKNNIDRVSGISVHIRRGDYVSDPKTRSVHGVCSEEYYKQAIDLMRAKVEAPIFYFFSDDIEWVKKEFGEHVDFKYVSNPKLEDYEELMLMSSCAHNIIANSSFSWWGAYLNQNPSKIVIAPKKWVNKEPDPHPNIIPAGWIRI